MVEEVFGVKPGRFERGLVQAQSTYACGCFLAHTLHLHQDETATHSWWELTRKQVPKFPENRAYYNVSGALVLPPW